MNPRKSNISPALSLGLAALLVVGCLMAALGVSFARYRTEEKDGIRFHPAQTAQVYLGYMENGSFICDQSSWEKTAGLLQLSFAVSNGQSVSSYAKANQQATVRLIASLGAWQENSTESMHLFVGDQFYTAVAEGFLKAVHYLHNSVTAGLSTLWMPTEMNPNGICPEGSSVILKCRYIATKQPLPIPACCSCR